MENPMTTTEFFIKICANLKTEGRIPSIIDYILPAEEPALMTTCEFTLKNSLDHGESEGIYLDLWIEYHDGEKLAKHALGTIKTLYHGYTAMHRMAKLLADFIMEARDYVQENLDDFRWERFEVYAFLDIGKKTVWTYCCYDMDSAMKSKDELLNQYQCVVVRDNQTRKEQVFGTKTEYAGKDIGK